MQYQTRRNMFLALDEMHRMRAGGKLEELIKIAEHELGVHYQIKSGKLMPRKKEFTTEICNLIGLTYLDRLVIPQNSTQMSGLELMGVIFEVSVADKKKSVPYIFGDQSTYRDPAKPDTSFLVFKRNISRLEGRLKQANTPIERGYLYHEMGKYNLKQSNYEECRNFARKVIDEAAATPSYLWDFLGRILICRAFLMQRNVLEIYDSMKVALQAVEPFQNPELSGVIESCVAV